MASEAGRRRRTMRRETERGEAAAMEVDLKDAGCLVLLRCSDVLLVHSAANATRDGWGFRP
jgi:hypothetical protein